MLTFDLPFPHKDLSPNARVHWRVIHNKASAAKDAAWAVALSATTVPRGSMSGPIRVNMVFHPPANYTYDRDNLQARMKSALDGIALALGVNDSNFIPFSDIAEKRPPHGCVTVTIIPAEVNIPFRGQIS